MDIRKNLDKIKKNLSSSTKKRKGYSAPKSRLAIAKEAKSSRTKYKISGKPKALKRIKFRKTLKKIAIIFAGIFLTTIVVGGVVVLAELQQINKELPSPDNIFPEVPIATYIYDRNEMAGQGQGTTLYKLFGDVNSEKVDVQNISDFIKASFISAEDDNFFNHAGYDIQAIIRCAINNLRKTDTCGGSTITQQLVKRVTKDDEVDVMRKVRELLTAVSVEQNYTKNEILEMYLRVTAFGSNIQGISTAASFYFYKDKENPDLGGKEPQELTLAEAAALASIVRNPARLSPTMGVDLEASRESLKARMTFIFDQMEAKLDGVNSQLQANALNQEGWTPITKEMIDAARTEDWEANLKPPIATDLKAGHFVRYTIDQLQTRNYKNGEMPFTEEELQTGGYKIYTSLDYKLQEIAEKYVKQGGNDFKYWNAYNAAVMTTRPSTGEIITMAGSKDFYGEDEECGSGVCKYNGQVNVFTTLQSPGSTNKVMGYYMAYKEGMLFTGSNLPDIPIKLGDYEPKNWNGGFLGERQNAGEMLRQSRNLPAIQVIQMVGVDNYVKTAKEWGYTTYENQDLGPSVILGGTDVYPVEHVQAQSVFANGGDLVEIDPILKIEDKDGNIVYEAKPARKQVGDPQGVFLLNKTLNRLDTLGTPIYWDDREIAGKTGTSEDSKDAWIMMWSPELVTLGWAGNNNNDPMDLYYGYPAFVVQPWIQPYMREISQASYFNQKTPFARPGFVYEGGGDCDAKGECLGSSRGWLIQDREPKRGDVVVKKIKVCKDQTNRLAREIDIQLGFAEEQTSYYYRMPVADWQGFLDKYISDKGFTNGGPKDECNKNRTGGVTEGTYFNITGVSATTSSINIKGGIFSISGEVTNADFRLNGSNIPGCNVPSGSYSSFDITCNINSLNLDNGIYKFRITASDDTGAPANNYNTDVTVGSETSDKFSFTIKPSGSLNWGAGGASGVGDGNSKNFTVVYTGGALENVKLCVQKNGGSADCSKSMGGGVGGYSTSWGGDIPNEGATYTFYVIANTSSGNGSLRSSETHTVVVNPE